MQGVGVHRLSNGEVYEGEFRKNKRHGTGRYTTPLGIYVGKLYLTQGAIETTQNKEREDLPGLTGGLSRGLSEMAVQMGLVSSFCQMEPL